MRGRCILLTALLAAGCQSFDSLRADDPAVGEVEVFEAGAANDDGSLTPHLHRILEEPGDYEQASVVAALGAVAEQRDAAAVPLVRALAAEHADEEVRWHAAYALSAIGGDEARDELARLAEEDPSEMVRRFARDLLDGGSA
jgi:HEAT repeat protein